MVRFGSCLRVVWSRTERALGRLVCDADQVIKSILSSDSAQIQVRMLAFQASRGMATMADGSGRGRSRASFYLPQAKVGQEPERRDVLLSTCN